MSIYYGSFIILTNFVFTVPLLIQIFIYLSERDNERESAHEGLGDQREREKQGVDMELDPTTPGS